MMRATAAYSIAFTRRSVKAVEGDMTSKTMDGSTISLSSSVLLQTTLASG